MGLVDPLADVLDLEGRFYQQGYQEGLADGARAGRVEGRLLGLERGFDKFLESGRLAARAVVWANRLPREQQQQQQQQEEEQQPNQQQHQQQQQQPPPPPPTRCALPPLPPSARLAKNVRTLYALVEPDTLSMDNTDEAIQDFDDRVKRAQGRAKVVQRMAG